MKRKFIRARELRQNSTFGEMSVWRNLKTKQFSGFKFRRQHPIGEKYIVDFFCKELKLIIEIDGGSHTEETFEYDQERQKYLENLGYKVLRFSEYDARFHIQRVMNTLWVFMCKTEETPPQPSPTS